MRSNFIALTAMALAGLFATVHAEDTWFAIYNETSGEVMDSDDSTVKTNTPGSLDNINDNDDKGQRWKFRDGAGKNSSYISTQAHQDHIVGYDSGDNEFHADFKQSNTGSAVKAYFPDDKHVILCFNENCIGQGGRKEVGPNAYTVWSYGQVEGA